eukprot:CAMPEP_0204590726 /NCGR_PEP_ID=MMETSP0661-20131031/49953_1 /ASSEMBLY_ACC=CAM_ASM_000606 /TAXON_ID=109239 /ORGANISM="Alexandrium margalefi, Strain AMGDE01CS-322" /LENGTH=30 /DNA_ID= /DNA_START= /DNA_END= /DNA_ORIENTATION=
MAKCAVPSRAAPTRWLERSCGGKALFGSKK